MNDQVRAKTRYTKLSKKQIAQLCGISRISLDRVLKGEPGVSESKRLEVLRYLDENGYRENKLAQSLKRGRSKSLGIIVFDLENSFYAQLVNAFARTAQAAQYETYIMLSDKDQHQEKRLVEALLARQVDGIVINSAVKDSHYGAYLAQQPCPVLAIMNHIDETIPFIGFDDYAAMRELTQHALRKGYRHFYYVCPPLVRACSSNMDSLLRRRQGFEDEVSHQAGLQIEMLTDDSYIDQLMQIDQGGNKACILCTSDIYALEIQAALRRKGLRAPADYGIAGFDNIPILGNLEPRLTTVSLQIELLGHTAAKLLIEAACGTDLPPYTHLSHKLLSHDSL